MNHMNNVENQCTIRLCTNHCYCINIGSDIGPPAVLYRYGYWLKNAISVADIVADPIIGTPLFICLLVFLSSLNLELNSALSSAITD